MVGGTYVLQDSTSKYAHVTKHLTKSILVVETVYVLRGEDHPFVKRLHRI